MDKSNSRRLDHADVADNQPRLLTTFRRRQAVFCDTESGRDPALGWLEQSRDGIRDILGFFVGEAPVTHVPVPGAAPAAGRCSPATVTAQARIAGCYAEGIGVSIANSREARRSCGRAA